MGGGQDWTEQRLRSQQALPSSTASLLARAGTGYKPSPADLSLQSGRKGSGHRGGTGKQGKRAMEGPWQLKSTGLTSSISSNTSLPVMTYGTTEHLVLETSQAFASPTSSTASHSWKTGFLSRILKWQALPASYCAWPLANMLSQTLWLEPSNI